MHQSNQRSGPSGSVAQASPKSQKSKAPTSASATADTTTELYVAASVEPSVAWLEPFAPTAQLAMPAMTSPTSGQRLFF
jgi:hypothetical protein